MKKLVLFQVLLLCVVFTGFSQNYIGKHKDDVQELMKTHMNDFHLDNSTVNKVYKYLKYVDKYNEQTLLYFLDEKDFCTSSKLMGDYSVIDAVIEKLDNNYKKIDDNNWEYMDERQEYTVNLEEGEWFFTIRTKKKE